MYASTRLGEIRAVLANALASTGSGGGGKSPPTRCKGACASNGKDMEQYAVLHVDMCVECVRIKNLA